MTSDELMLKVENVSKVYKLGEIGGTTLRDELQRLSAKIRKKEDPTKKVDAENYNKGEKFKALDNISFEVYKGERIGIIGHNGAGKSTLLKLISRVTGPTNGKIFLNGRVASMLEVGTGFHPELTGRENIYMNGAILGMTKKEIDAKIEDIIDFSEVRQFIDTPVKRYSSGMYVKLAFSVAAHLNSEIMIMDEVLAVGDMSFQNKCLNKMKEVSEEENRTILYVSHNMNTIRQLCNKVVVLKNGRIEFFGDVERGIEKYLSKSGVSGSHTFLGNMHRLPVVNKKVVITDIFFLNCEHCVFDSMKPVRFKICWKSLLNAESLLFRMTITSSAGTPVSTKTISIGSAKEQSSYESFFEMSLSNYASGDYIIHIGFFQKDNSGKDVYIDFINNATFFSLNNEGLPGWHTIWHGFIDGPELTFDADQSCVAN